MENNGRISHEEISRRLNISRPAIHHRISKLEQKKIIKGYSTIIDWSSTGQAIKAFVFINIRTNSFSTVMEKIVHIKIPGLSIKNCYRITGQWCIMLRIRARLPEQITLLHDELLKIEGMLDTFTMLILFEADRDQQ